MPGRGLITILIILFSAKSFSQQQLLPAGLTAKLDSVRMSTGSEAHFGELYLKTTIAADAYIESLPGEGRILMKKLEQNFAEYFFHAIDANYNGAIIPEEWKNYFNGKELSALQLKLMGANAHINGDIWQAMTSSFSLEEIKMLKPFYKDYNKSIAKIFDDLFESAIEFDKRLRNLHSMTLGLDKVYGRMMLRKWRNRQLKLAIYSFYQPGKFKRLKKRTESRRKKLDNIIMKRLRQPGQ